MEELEGIMAAFANLAIFDPPPDIIDLPYPEDGDFGEDDGEDEDLQGIGPQHQQGGDEGGLINDLVDVQDQALQPGGLVEGQEDEGNLLAEVLQGFDLEVQGEGGNWDVEEEPQAGSIGDEEAGIVEDRVGVGILVDTRSELEGYSWFQWLFVSMVKWMRNERVELEDLIEFLFSKSICSAFSENKIRFVCLRQQKNKIVDAGYAAGSGICKIYGAREYLPMFLVNYSALPSYFKLMHARIILGSLYFSNSLRIECSFLPYDSAVSDVPALRDSYQGEAVATLKRGRDEDDH